MTRGKMKETGDNVRCIGHKIRDAMVERKKVFLWLGLFIVLATGGSFIDEINFNNSSTVEAKTSGVGQIISKEELKNKKSEYLLEEATESKKQLETTNQMVANEEEASAGVDELAITNVATTNALGKEEIIASILTSAGNLSTDKNIDEENDINSSSNTVENLGTETVCYTVQRGDTLWGIAMKYGTTVEDLARINGIPDVNLIITGQVLNIELSSNLLENNDENTVSIVDQKEDVSEEEKRIQEWANTPAKVRYEYTDEDVRLTACVGKAESGDSYDRYYSMQVFVNRQHLNNTSALTEVTKPDQYKTTWNRIKSGQITVTDEDLELAEKMLSGQINGFEGSGTDIPEELWGYVYFQSQEQQEVGEYEWSSGVHYYSVSKYIKPEGF